VADFCAKVCMIRGGGGERKGRTVGFDVLTVVTKIEPLASLPLTILINQCILRMLLHSVVSVVTAYGLDDREVGGRVPVGTSPRFQTGSGVHSASYPMGTGGSFSRGKEAEA
jgi:hypothetical protein